jgi:AraC-like DNA-binding protein
VEGASRLLAVRLFPWTVPSLVDVNPRIEIAELDERWQAFGEQIAATVRDNGVEEGIARLQQHIGDQLRTKNESATLREAGMLLYAGRGRFESGDAGARGYFSLSQFERRFKHSTGISPKLYARLVRFEAVCDALSEDPDRSLTGLAHDFGYADQSHFNHDFKALSGLTPGAMARYARSYQRRIAEFLQEP